MPRCARCGGAYQLVERARAGDLCPSCGGPVCACINCKLYHPGAYNDCSSTTTDPVHDKERVNHCDEFIPAEKPVPRRSRASSWDDLFKKP